MKRLKTHNKNIHSSLISQCRKGDRKAQYEIYQLYHIAMFNTAYRIINNREDAEDILQEAFINAFLKLSSYKEQSTFGAWLKRIVINKSLELLKKRNEFETIEQQNEKAIPVDNSDEETIKYTVDTIKIAIHKLPVGFRTVLSLYLFEGYDHKEIASILNIVESTSKTQYKRAKSKLQYLLNEMRYENP